MIARSDVSATRRSLHRRDRERFVEWQRQAEATGWDPDRADPSERVATWLAEHDGGMLMRRLASATTWSLRIAVVLAAALGVAAALALFRYDGSRPINVFWVLLVFVALPLTTACLSWVGMLTGWPRADWTIGASATSWLWRRLAGREEGGEVLAELAGHWRRHTAVLSRPLSVYAWWVGQGVGLAFVAAGTLTFTALLGTSDLAFGWSSTFDLDPEILSEGLGYALWFAPSLAPDVVMLEATVAERATPFVDRYAANPEAFKAWWLPLLALTVVYGVLPRFLLTLWADLRHSHVVRRAFATHPAVREIDARMTTPFVETHEPAGLTNQPEADEADGSTLPAHELASVDAATRWVVWADAPRPAAMPTDDLLRAGGEALLEDDRRTLDILGRAPNEASVAILTKAWEPPLGEFTDWLRGLRERLGDGRSIEVVAVIRGEHDEPLARVWDRKLAQIGDPWLRVSVAPVPREGDA